MHLHLIPFLLAPVVVSAAAWSPNNESDKFGEFIKAVQEAPTMEETPLSGWLVPTWKQLVESVEIPTEEFSWFPSHGSEPELHDNLAILINPNMEFGRWSLEIENTLQEKGKRIMALLSQSPSAEVYEGLKGYAKHLVESANRLAEWSLNDRVRGVLALRPATMIGVCQAREFLPSELRLKELVQFVFKEGSLFPATQALELTHDFASLLGSVWHNFPNLSPKIGDLIDRLHMIYSSQLNEIGCGFLEVIPVGHRFAFGTVSKAGYAAIVDMIKAEDGFIYGLKYATDEFTHAPSIAFRLPHSRLSQLSKFLGESYSPLHDIGSLGEVIEWKAVQLKWYPVEPITQPTAMVRRYVLGGHATQEHLVLGTILQYCKELGSFSSPHGEYHREMVEKIQSLSPSAAGKLHEIVTKLRHFYSDDKKFLDEISAGLFIRSQVN